MQRQQTKKTDQNDSDINQQSSQQFTQQSTTKNLSKSKKNNKKKKTYIPSLVANLSDTKYPVVKKVLKNQLKFKIIKQTQNQDWDLFWTDNAVQPQQLANLKIYQKINHFPGMYSLSRKNYLARNLLKMSKQFQKDYNFYPQTWVLPSELNELKKYMQTDTNCVLIAKPQASSQGRGIFLTKSADDFQFGQHYVVQKYMKKPFLIDNLKFDLRIYVLVAGCDPLRVYIYKQGLARFATQPYSIPKKQNMKNLYMHLTNYAINKHSNKFKFNTSQQQMNQGHKRSLTSVLTHLQKQGHNVSKLWKQTKQIILKTLISVQPILSHHYRSCQPQNYSNNMCFQILGFDVIIDQNLQPSILQVNYTPSFTTDTPLDQKIKENLIKDTVVLMNMTLKTKNQLINVKKKQMNQRVLTGKKQFLNKQERQKMIKYCQLQRDQWENQHLENFQKVYPFQNPSELYQKFHQYAEKCYHQGTGTNIKRNTKVPVKSMLVKKQEVPPEVTIQKIKQQRQMKHHLKANELQKIYRTKFRPMLPFKNKQNLKERISQHQDSQFEQTNQKQGFTPSKKQYKHQVENQDQKVKQPYKQGQFPSYKMRVQQKTNNSNSKTVNSIKVQPKNTIYNRKNVFKRPLSAAGHKGISTVYNITFKQITLKKK